MIVLVMFKISLEGKIGTDANHNIGCKRENYRNRLGIPVLTRSIAVVMITKSPSLEFVMLLIFMHLYVDTFT